MSGTGLEQLLDDERRNAVLAWPLVALLLVVGLAELAVGDFVWSVFALVVATLALVPPVAFRSREVMLPWEVLLMAALPVIGLAFGSARLTNHFASYLAVAAVALVIVVELQAFTSVRMSPSFAVVVVVVATMAAAGLWALVRFGFDNLLGTTTVTDNDVIMVEFVYSALAGVGAGVVFEIYFRRSVTLEDRIPADIAAEVLDE